VRWMTPDEIRDNLNEVFAVRVRDALGDDHPLMPRMQYGRTLASPGNLVTN
jgi:hypothetical protein